MPKLTAHQLSQAYQIKSVSMHQILSAEWSALFGVVMSGQMLWKSLKYLQILGYITDSPPKKKMKS